MKNIIKITTFFCLFYLVISLHLGHDHHVMDENDQVYSYTSPSSFELSTGSSGNKQDLRRISFFFPNSMENFTFSLPTHDLFLGDVQKSKIIGTLFPIKFQSTFISLSSFQNI